jgi:hypothetical protein
MAARHGHAVGQQQQVGSQHDIVVDLVVGPPDERRLPLDVEFFAGGFVLQHGILGWIEHLAQGLLDITQHQLILRLNIELHQVLVGIERAVDAFKMQGILFGCIGADIVELLQDLLDQTAHGEVACAPGHAARCARRYRFSRQCIRP